MEQASRFETEINKFHVSFNPNTKTLEDIVDFKNYIRAMRHWNSLIMLINETILFLL